MCDTHTHTVGKNIQMYMCKESIKFMKSKVGMAVLKSKTNKSSKDDQHIRVVHPYVCFFSSDCVILPLLFIDTAKLNCSQKANVGMYYTYALIIPTTRLFALALLPLLHFSTLFFILSLFTFL